MKTPSKNRSSRAALWILGALFVVGCITPVVPEAVTNFFSGGKPEIARAIEEAAADWARHGLEIANFVTVDDEGEGILVRYATDEELRSEGFADTTLGAARAKNGKWVDVLLYDGLQSNPEKLLQFVKHELIHVLVPRAGHLEGVGIFSKPVSSLTITRADMQHLARSTKVGPSLAPFTGEETA